jgi:hypothetical protein
MSRVSHDIEITYKRAWSREPSLPIFGIFCAVIALPLRVGISIQYSTRHMETLQLTCRLWMVSIMLYLVQGYPTGAPEEACSTFVPLHKGNKAQDGDGGYKLTLDTDEGFTPGRFHTVTLSGSRSFKGFLIVAKSNASLVSGSWDVARLPRLARTACSNTGVTHRSNVEKTSIQFYWTPLTTECVDFHYTVVETFTEFYVNQVFTTCPDPDALEADDSEEEPSVGGCEATRYGCCSDGVNTATGSILLGCPASVSGSGPSSDPLNSGSSEPPLIGGCAGTRYGCCRDGVTAASGNNFLGCPSTSPSGSGSGSSSGRPPLIGGCEATRYGCCSDGTTAATGRILLGCPSTSGKWTSI